jgi:hypothetical protein
MPLPIDPENIRKKVQRAQGPSAKGDLASEQLPLEVVQLLDVCVRIEIRRQARLRAAEQEEAG